MLGGLGEGGGPPPAWRNSDADVGRGAGRGGLEDVEVEELDAVCVPHDLVPCRDVGNLPGVGDVRGAVGRCEGRGVDERAVE